MLTFESTSYQLSSLTVIFRLKIIAQQVFFKELND